MIEYDWAETYRRCYDEAVDLYRAGQRDPSRYLGAEDAQFLASIGCSRQEMYDFAEDWCTSQQPAFETSLLVTAVRRDYFLVVQRGARSSNVVPAHNFPAREAQRAGFAWLPRIIAKARAKLRGEMPVELMYCCGGDREFLQKVGVHPADFLRVVWAAGDDEQEIADYVTRHAAGPAAG